SSSEISFSARMSSAARTWASLRSSCFNVLSLLSGQSLSQALHIANKLLHFLLREDDDSCPTDLSFEGRRARRRGLLPIRSDIQCAEAHAQRCNDKQVPLHNTVITVRTYSVQMFAVAAKIPSLLTYVSVECH